MNTKQISADQLRIVKGFYSPWCLPDQIERIFAPQSADDELLKIRAEEINENIRLYRVVRAKILSNKANRSKVHWDFTEIFNDSPFSVYKTTVPPEFLSKAEVTAGFVYSTNPNGSCIKTDFGNVITVSEALKQFLYYMNLAHLKFSEEIPPEVTYASRTISIRTMLLTESLDFELDPRGIVPPQIDNEIQRVVARQLFFIISHEFAHHFCNHLEERSLITKNLINTPGGEPNTERTLYNPNQLQEFEADEHAIRIPVLTPDARRSLLEATLFALAYFELYQVVADYFSPPRPTKDDHPSSLDRIRKLSDTFKDEFPIEDLAIGLYNMIEVSRDELVEDAGYNTDNYEFKGSMYLGAPNTKWRGRELIDRKDF